MTIYASYNHLCSWTTKIANPLGRILLFLSLLCYIQVYSQEKYSIVADSPMDSSVCAANCPFFDFDSQELIIGSTIPDQLIAYRHGSIEDVQITTESVLGECFQIAVDGLPVSLYVVIDSLGVVRGIVTNVGDNDKMSLIVAKVALNYLKSLSFSPATLRGKPIVYGFPIFIRIREKPEIGMGVSFESMPSYENDRNQDKLFKLVKDNLKQFDTLSKPETVYVQFIVDTLGVTHQHKVLRGVNEQLDAEALRVCRMIKFDHPAKLRGKPVSMTNCLPIKFEPRKDFVSPKKKSRFIIGQKCKDMQNTLINVNMSTTLIIST